MRFLLSLKSVLKKTLTLATFTLSGLAFANSPQLPQYASHKHNGVASCATSACHGKTAPVEGRNVWLNEYHLWSTEDHHSRAYQTLKNDLSKAIAKRLNLPNAHTAKVCLDCHTDNIPVEKRGAKFQISDGVGCEACHGGSEKWLKTHTEPDATHERNIAQGLYPTESAYSRAALCLSCHMGTSEKFADHQMMAAGHPRLTYELDTFTANQPGHYNIDADYTARKGKFEPGYMWMVGQIESAKRLLELIDQHGTRLSSKSLAIYDCHSCHRPMKPRRGQPNDFSRVLPVGSTRLHDASLDMLSALIELLEPAHSAAWKTSVENLHRHSLSTQLPESSQTLREQIARLENTLNKQSLSIAQLQSLRKILVRHGISGHYDDFTSAEQAFLALESLSFSIGDRNKILTQLDAVYAAVKDEFTFNPSAFNASLNQLQSQL